MTVFEWKANYEVGNTHIDNEHKIFLNLIQKLAKDVDNSRDKDSINRTFDEVVKCAKFHFLSEENLMLDEGFPGYTEHKKIHHNLLIKVDQHFEDYNNDKINLKAVVTFLLDWFIGHTVCEDIKIGVFIAERQLR